MTGIAVNPEHGCIVTDVFSGDDLVGFVDLGVESLWKRQRMRLYGIDTPPAIGLPPESEAGKVRTYIRNLVLRRKATVMVHSKTLNSWVVTLMVEQHDGSTVNVNEYLKSQGYEFKR